MEVIGAGLGRTGTRSLKAALEQLGFDPCYHMAEVYQYGDAQKWIDCAQQIQRGEDFDFDKIFVPEEKGRPAYKAAVDHPSAAYYEQMMKQYPNAKVILTVRDSPEQWYASAKSTIYEFTKGGSIMARAMTALVPSLRRFMHMVDLVAWSNPRLFGGLFEEDGHAVAVYKRWVEEVKACVPEGKLLVFNAKEGWEPLCRFLGIPVPEYGDGTKKPYPCTNERAQFLAMNAGRERFVWGVTAALGACLGVMLWWFTKSR
eukprot:jgi/Chlat1/7933/Chrsp68S07365